MAASGSGELCVWQMPPLASEEEVVLTDEGLIQLGPANESKLPVFRLQIPGSPTLYSLEYVHEKQWIVAAGDGGVYLYNWTDIEQLILAREGSKSLAPRAHFKLYPSAVEARIEVNDTCCKANALYGAAGDSFGCYKWDVETGQILCTYACQKKRNPRAYLQSVENLKNTSLLMTGGEEGVLGLWDASSDKLVDKIDIATALGEVHTVESSVGQSQRLRAPNNRQKMRCTISGIACRDENWWTLGGGLKLATESSRASTMSGYLATFHAPTRSLLSSVYTRERPQQLEYFNDSKLLTVGNEGWISSYSDPLSLSNGGVNKIWCSSPSAYAVKTDDVGRVAVAGVGGVVNVYEKGTQLTATLRIQRRMS